MHLVRAAPLQDSGNQVTLSHDNGRFTHQPLLCEINKVTKEEPEHDAEGAVLVEMMDLR
jgi:hypothetical protein